MKKSTNSKSPNPAISKEKGRVQIKEENNSYFDAQIDLTKSKNPKNLVENKKPNLIESKSKESVEKNLENKLKAKNESFQKIKVAIRVRQIQISEYGKQISIFIDPEGKTIKTGKDGHYFETSFDNIFGTNSSQDDIFNYTLPSINSFLNGVNSTVFVYGQTGTGKTFTMFGKDWCNYKQSQTENVSVRTGKKENTLTLNINPYSDDNGIIPRALNHILSEIELKNTEKEKFSISLSFFQIYNEKIFDLLSDENQINEKTKSLKILEDPINGIVIEDLSEIVAENILDAIKILKKAEKLKIIRSTKKNITSSRSHSILQIILHKEGGSITKTKLNLCDLAGSERIEKDDQDKAKVKETININLSLSTLGKVIHSLATKQSSVPYRESCLTRFLCDSLGGNTLTSLIATISPSIDNYDETVSTLKFADRAKNVITKLKQFQENKENENLVKTLKNEIESYKNILNLRKKRGNFNVLEDEVLRLRRENMKLKQYVVSNSELERIIEENRNLKLEVLKYKSDYFDSKHNESVGENESQNKQDMSYSMQDYPQIPRKPQYQKSLNDEETSNKYYSSKMPDITNRNKLARSGELIVGRNNLSNEENIRSLENKIKILQKLGIETGLNLENEIYKAENELNIIKDYKKYERKRKENDPLEKIKYLYRSPKEKVYDYESLMRNYKNKPKNEKLKNYEDIINSKDREEINYSNTKNVKDYTENLNKSIEDNDFKKKIKEKVSSKLENMDLKINEEKDKVKNKKNKNEISTNENSIPKKNQKDQKSINIQDIPIKVENTQTKNELNSSPQKTTDNQTKPKTIQNLNSKRKKTNEVAKDDIKNLEIQNDGNSLDPEIMEINEKKEINKGILLGDTPINEMDDHMEDNQIKN